MNTYKIFDSRGCETGFTTARDEIDAIHNAKRVGVFAPMIQRVDKEVLLEKRVVLNQSFGKHGFFSNIRFYHDGCEY